jgi:hypothetical protein
MKAVFCFAVLILGLTSVATALEPLPVPEPQQPRNKWEVSRWGDAAEIKSDGYFVYATPEGLSISPIRSFKPQSIPETKDAGYVDISDDGLWLLYSTREAVYLIRPDGSGKATVPVKGMLSSNKDLRHTTQPAVFYHHGPLGSEIAFIENGRTIKSIAVDLSKDPPTFGATRTLVDFAGLANDSDQPFKFEFNHDCEQRFTVARNHVFINVNVWAGGAVHHMITIPDGGRGTATGRQHIFKRVKSPKWECGPAMSHCGSIVSQNPGAKINDGFPNTTGGGHKETVVCPFYEADQPPLEVARDLYGAKALAISWAPAEMRGAAVKADFHHWYFSNDPGYIIGTNQGERGMRNKVEDYKAIGIYLLHWPSGTYYRISDDKTRSRYMAAHFFRPETQASLRLPAGFSAAPVQPTTSAGGEPKTDKPDAAAATAGKVVLEVTARELSAVPGKDEIAIYKHISRFIRYEVTRVVSGNYDGKAIVVGHWSVKDGKFTPAAQYQAGQRFLITCQPVGEEDGITMAQRIDDITDLDLPRYWALSAETAK